MLEALSHPEQHYAVVHVGGTNGKGSVATLVYEALRQAGWSVGLYTSPHLVDVRERFVVDGRPITHEAFVMWVERLRPVIERTGASFFDAGTAIAFADFAARGVDLGVVEVGLGGRLDSTNVVQPAVSVVTRIALEHAEYLGPTLADIAREKAGIAKPGVPFVVGEERPDVRSVLRDTAERLGAHVIEVAPEERYAGPIGLTGAYQRRNAAVAARALAALPEPWRPSPEAVRRAFAWARVPGRFDRRGPWIFDVAHNPDGTEALCLALLEAGPPRPLHAVIGILGDKDWRAMLQRLLPVLDAAWLTDPPSAPAGRKWSLEEVGRIVGHPPLHRSELPAVTLEPDFDLALAAARRGAATVLVTGSFHTVGDALGRLPGFAPLG